MVWSAVIFGPDDTCWDGGTFKLKLEFEEDYPNKAPKVTFVCPMFHPNVYPKDGVVCLDILQKHWSPIYDVSAVLTSVQSLLSDPNCTSPANNDAAKLFTDNRREYNRKVKEVVQKSWIDDSSAAETAEDDAPDASGGRPSLLPSESKHQLEILTTAESNGNGHQISSAEAPALGVANEDQEA